MKNQIKLLGIIFIALFFFSCSDDDPMTSCTDGIMNGSEIGIDCGGSDCSPCPTCFDGILNGSETGVDCGGLECEACNTCNDNIQNGSETGVDCGGPDCEACSTCNDNIQNGDETGIDCGGSICPPCPIFGCLDSQAHNYDPLATQDDGSCETCTDGIFNGDEISVDCGGTLCSSCPSVGDTGPGGGFIFYDKGSYSDGWRYLEAGPFLSTLTLFGCIGDYETSAALGAGKLNTENIVKAFNLNQCSPEPSAARFASILDVNGIDDYYLPSTLELQKVFTYRTQIGYPVNRYWASNDLNASVGFVVDFGGSSNGIPDTYSFNKTEVNNQGKSAIIAIRRF